MANSYVFNIDAATDINFWKTPATEYPKIELGSARIVREDYKRGYYRNYGVRGINVFKVTKPIPVTSLEIKDREGKWHTWMVDDPPHLWSMYDYGKNSRGRVLIAGLGLGLIIWGLENNVDVNSITVVEMNKDVIDLITPMLPIEKITGAGVDFRIINQDFYDFLKETKEDFDRIIVDLWTTGSKEETEKILEEEVLPLVRVLLERFPAASVVFHGFGIAWNSGVMI